MTGAGTARQPQGDWRNRASLALACCTAVIGAYVAFHTLWMVITCWSPLPFGDQWSEIITGRAVTPGWLLSQHMEHRLLVPRLIFLADRFLAGESNKVDYAFNIAIPAGVALLVYRVSRGAGVEGRAGRIWAAGICSALLLWAGQYQNFVWGFQVQFVGVVLAAASLFAVVALRPMSPGTLTLAILLEFVAAYTLASGVLAGFLAAGLALALGRPRRLGLALLGAAVVITASYLFHYQKPPESSDPLDAWRHLSGVAVYFLVALGAPLGNLVLLHAPFGVGFSVCADAGLLGCYLFGRNLVAMWRERQHLNAHQTVLVALMGFVVCMLLITATGRYVKGIESALVSRYATPAVTFWCCLVLLAAARSAPASSTTAARANATSYAVVMGWALPLALLMGLSESGNVAAARDWVHLRDAAEPAVLAGVTDLDLLRNIFAVEPGAPWRGSAGERWIPLLKASRNSVFGEAWAGWLGTRLDAHITRIDPNGCVGAAGPAMQVQQTPVAGWRATGWARIAGSGKAVKRLVFVDRDGVIVGYAVGGLDLARIGLAGLKSPHPVGADWIGDFLSPMADGVSAVALSDDLSLGCLVPGATP